MSFFAYDFYISTTRLFVRLLVSVRLQPLPTPSVALAARGLGVVLLPRRPSGQPGGDGVRGGLLGHAVVADHRVEAAPGVGVLGGVVRLQGGRDAPLVLQGKGGGERGEED